MLSSNANNEKNRNYIFHINYLNVGPGDFAENILIDGLDLSNWVIENKIRLGTNVVLEITQIGKEDHPSIVSRMLGISNSELN